MKHGMMDVLPSNIRNADEQYQYRHLQSRYIVIVEKMISIQVSGFKNSLDPNSKLKPRPKFNFI